MRLMDIYYRAFRAFRKHTTEDYTSQKLRKIIAHSNHQEDRLTSIKYECLIDSDWIENIEEGLIFVEKAIREDRQFIRTEGEVVPIEKVKRTSKSSIEHLSRHSDFITRAPKENENLIPDKLYIVEKLNDYLVYENRFIYMLLCYLKDFIQMRLDKIKDKTTSYESHMQVNKSFDANQRHVTYTLSYDDLYKNEPYLVDQYKKIPLVNRIETIYAIAVSLLSTPLMKEVSKAPMIKPPVVKTNVLRMNQNFRASLKLYDFITSYSKDGYTFKEVKKVFNPFPIDMADEMAETIQLTSVISYIVGNELHKDFDKRYQHDEEEILKAQKKVIQDEIKRLKKKIQEMNEDPAEYMVKLEKINSQLEKENDTLESIIEQNKALLETIEMLENEKNEIQHMMSETQEIINSKDASIEQMKVKFLEDMRETEQVHQLELKTQSEHHAQHVLEMQQTHQLQIDSMQQTHAQEKQVLMQEHQEYINQYQARVQQLNLSLGELKDEMKKEKANYQNSIDHLTEKTAVLESELIRLDDEKRYANAQYLGLKMKQGLITDADDYSSKERFKELELELVAYKKLFKAQWKKAKSKIKENVRSEFSKVEPNTEENVTKISQDE